MSSEAAPPSRSDATAGAVADLDSQIAFLDRLARTTQPMSDPAEVMQITARLLGTHMGVNRCAYAEVDPDEDHFTLTGDFSRGVDSIVGRYTFSQFGLDCLELMRANLPYVVHDIDTDPRAAGMDLSAYRLTAIQAVICVPLHKDGRFVAAMAVHQRTPRRWNKPEIELVQLVCSRCWESLQRTRAHHAIQLTNERLNIALAAAEMGDWSWSAATDVVSLSPRAAALFRVPVAPVTWHELARLIHEDDRERTLAAVQASVRSGKTYREEYRLAGSHPPRWLSVWGTPQTDDAGVVAGIFGVVQESTVRKQMEQDLREADQKKDEFLAVLAHELRNPLAPIGLAAQMLKQSPDPATQNTAEMIRTQVFQISRLLDDLLDTSRIKTGRMTVKKELVHARTAIELALQNAGSEVRRRNHSVTLKVEDDLALQADPVRLAQIITNLLTNAAKYTPVGGRIEICASSAGELCEFVVSDNGMGLTPQSFERIFEMFSQEGAVLHRPEGGLGIGLALSRAICAAHGGTIVAESAGLGKGSRFIVRLPVGNVPPNRASDKALPMPTMGGRRAASIVIADDNLSAVTLLAELLRMEGHEVHVATDGAQALTIAEAVRPSVLILDIGMPKLTGYEVAQAVRCTPWGQQAFLLAATGWGQEADKARARAAGFDAHLIKPFDPVELLDVLERRVGTAGEVSR
ncbi:signal transduction histidine kinase/CheY-like chemotaxis protein [Variovorax sp. OAS795]|uniref:hybrid sensor histidine kinase/response regulator n=1 Tax=Variovorax sp. OAS795 TaxID=3034231 RepID=UPI003394A382